MNISLEDVYLATGTIAFVLISVAIITTGITLYRASKRIEEAQAQGEKMIHDAMYRKYTIKAGILRALVALLGGDDQHER